MNIPPPPPAKLAYSIKEAVSLLPWGKSKVYELIASGELPSGFKYGRRYVLHADLMALLISDGAPGADVGRTERAA